MASSSKANVEGIGPVSDQIGQATRHDGASPVFFTIQARSHGGVELDGMLRSLHAR